MEQPGLSFLMNLTANSGNFGAGGAASLVAEASDASAVNAFFTIHAGLAAGDRVADNGPLAAIANNGPVEGFFHHFDAARTGLEAHAAKEFFVTPANGRVDYTPAAETYLVRGTAFDVNAATELFVAPIIDGADETPAIERADQTSVIETNSVQPGFDRRLRATDFSGADIERIHRLDFPNNSDERQNLTRPEISGSVRIGEIEKPVTAFGSGAAPDPGKNRELSAFVDERNVVGIFKNRDSGAGIAPDRQEFGAVSTAQDGALNKTQAQETRALPNEQKPPFVSVQHPAVNIGQQPAPNNAKPFDIAAFASPRSGRTRDIREHIGDIAIRANAPKIGASIGTRKAAPVAAPILGPGITAQPGEPKLANPVLDGAGLSEFNGADQPIDDVISGGQRPGLRSDVGRSATAFVSQAPSTMSAFAASAVAAERIAVEENFSTPVVELDAIGTASPASERAPIQFAPPTMTPPAGAAWAQVVSAISERTGEAKLELRLNPPELGRVIIGFESNGADLVRAVVSADSQQTLDLMRRNLDILERELARSGLDNINVEIADRDSRSQAHDANERFLAYASSDDAPANIDNNIPLAQIIADGRLDLRV